jgi:anti-anti-sigma factor
MNKSSASCDFLMVQAYEGNVLAKVMKERLLDLATITALADALNALLDRYPRISLVVDLSDVGYLSSAMLARLVAINKKVRQFKGRMALTSVKPDILQLFKVTKLDQLFDFAADAQEILLRYRRTPL